MNLLSNFGDDPTVQSPGICDFLGLHSAVAGMKKGKVMNLLSKFGDNPTVQSPGICDFLGLHSAVAGMKKGKPVHSEQENNNRGMNRGGSLEVSIPSQPQRARFIQLWEQDRVRLLYHKICPFRSHTKQTAEMYSKYDLHHSK
ncbi:ribosomal RNA large subunit methyltransferase M [Striga asiatica]|uniref:Ribosomal RNA large subunit methyltransferase M n=1 Tax=Striga asiatica TaxID=4170 RepID=A0A5A7QK11_STRAF|nr:ribosomal RNA large subunit methyltransferase M [Striga asiatica]